MNEKNQWWVFTLGLEDGKKYVKIYGTCDATRDKMFELYGRKWSSQYPLGMFEKTSMADTYECLEEIILAESTEADI